MGTFYHYLKDNKTQSCPHRFIFVDCETFNIPLDENRTELTLKCGWACLLELATKTHRQREVWLWFKTVPEFWQFVEQHFYKKTRLLVLAHNLAVDFTVLKWVENCRALDLDMKAPYFSSQTSIIKFSGNGRKLIALDTGNWFKGSVANLGKIVGEDKLHVDFDTATLDELCIYCFRDVEILVDAFKVWLKFIFAHELGSFGLTLPSQSFNAFRHRFMKDDILIHSQPSICQFEREGYFGGRVECSFIGTLQNGPYYMLDVNSLYPAVMLDTPVPIRKKFILVTARVKDLARYLKRYAVLALVEISTNDPAYPVRLRGRLIWPIGQFMTTLTTPELSYALDRGHISKVYRLVLYEKAKIFTKYVSYFHKLRTQYIRDGNFPFEQICKFMLNSLYGKFGQRCESWTEIENQWGFPDGEHEILNAETNQVQRLIVLANDCWIVEKGGESINSFTAIAAHVTAAARMRLWELIRKAGTEHVFYYDTDSLLVDRCGYSNLAAEIELQRLGKLKLEWTTDKITINGPKDYQTDTIVKRKGIRATAEQLSPRTFRQDKWPGFRGLLSDGATGKYVIEKIVKRLSRRYFKGTVTETGQVEPFLLPNELFT